VHESNTTTSNDVNGELTAADKRRIRTERIIEAGKATRFSSTNQPATNGNVPLMKNIVKGLDKDDYVKIMLQIREALVAGDRNEAAAILNKGGQELGEYGFVRQIVARALLDNRNSIPNLMALLERFFGKMPNVNINSEVDDSTAITGVTVNFKHYEKNTNEEIVEGEIIDEKVD
jgi:hypothetical protein